MSIEPVVNYRTCGVRKYTLNDLHEMLEPTGYNLVATLRTELRGWSDVDHDWLVAHMSSPFILVMRLPKTRTPGGAVETIELRAFVADRGLDGVGFDIGIWELSNGVPGILLTTPDEMRGQNTSLSTLSA